MKSTFITLTAVASLVGYSNAAMVFKDPWSQSKTWKSGEKAHISWTSSDATDADKLCDIQMLNGEAINSNIVATVTNPDEPVKCEVNEFEIVPLNDFKTGKYWLRIGQAKTNTWTYSGVFNFEGKDGTSADYPTAEAPKDDGMTKKEKKKEEKKEKKEEEKKEKKKEEKKERKESVPKLASQGSSSGASETAKATGSASPSKSSLVLSPTNSSKGNMPPTVKKDTKNTEHEKKANSAAVSDALISHSVVIGLASFAAYFLI